MNLEETVRAINGDTSLSNSEKAQQIHQVMISRWNRTPVLEEKGVGQRYRNPEKTIFGCKHYPRGCQIKAACCNKWFVCRLCHDDVETTHKIDRFATEQMYCMHCSEIQPIGQECSSCGETLGKYYCDVCKFHDNTRGKDIFHCPHCGICRVGKGLGVDFEHCHGCNACLSVERMAQHACIERTLESNCPICNDEMFASRKSCTFMPCGHAIHSTCLNSYLHSNFTCPICMKSIVEMDEYYERLEDFVNTIEIPSEYIGYVAHILCNDCLHKSHSKYHFYHHRCSGCNSFNTDVLKVLKPNDPEIPLDFRVAVPDTEPPAESQ